MNAILALNHSVRIKVRHFKLVKRVIAHARGCFSTALVSVTHAGAAEIPGDAMSFEVATTVPVVFTTTTCLITRVAAQAGERVLIHRIAGGGIGQSSYHASADDRCKISLFTVGSPDKAVLTAEHWYSEDRIFSAVTILCSRHPQTTGEGRRGRRSSP